MGRHGLCLFGGKFVFDENNTELYFAGKKIMRRGRRIVVKIKLHRGLSTLDALSNCFIRVEEFLVRGMKL